MMSFRLKRIQVIRLLQSSLSKVKLKLQLPNSFKYHPKKTSNLWKAWLSNTFGVLEIYVYLTESEIKSDTLMIINPVHSSQPHWESK